MRHRNTGMAAIGIVGLLCGVLALAACGGGNGGSAKATPTATPPSAASMLNSVQSAG